jgi:hypothetical protein
MSEKGGPLHDVVIDNQTRLPNPKMARPCNKVTLLSYIEILITSRASAHFEIFRIITFRALSI